MEDNRGFRYAAEKLDAAKRVLEMRPELEDDAIWSALHECWHGLKQVRRDELDAPARSWLNRLDVLRGGNDEPPDSEGIAGLDRVQRLEIYRCVVNLAEWFRAAENAPGWT